MLRIRVMLEAMRRIQVGSTALLRMEAWIAAGDEGPGSWASAAEASLMPLSSAFPERSGVVSSVVLDAGVAPVAGAGMALGVDISIDIGFDGAWIGF